MSDSDRHAVIDELQRHTADGRLTLDEFEERVDEVLRSRTGAELDTTMRDLPSLGPTAPRRSHSRRVPIGPIVTACVFIALLAAGLWWALIPLAFFVFGGCGHHGAEARSHRQNDRDEAVTYV